MKKLTIDKLQARLAGDEGFTLVELVIVMLILSILLLIAVPSYLGYRSKAQQVATQANVSSAVPAAEGYYSGPGNSSYTGLMRSTLMSEAPGVNPNIKAVSLNSGLGYCVEDSSGAYTYNYIGGTATLLAGSLGTIQSGSCLTDAGAAALST
jgi:prepilin-type N-terminal cleavage/methylation domain-containing protein